MTAQELLDFAFTSIVDADPAVSEAYFRRAISASYYALFHRLAAEGAGMFSAAGPLVTGRVSRVFSHGEMKKVCLQYEAWKPGADNGLMKITAPGRPEPGLVIVAVAFIKLQEAREIADYDLGAVLSQDDAIEALYRAMDAMRELEQIKDLPGTKAFLAALLMGDRLKQRRG